jgi:hypothetical protein
MYCNIHCVVTAPNAESIPTTSYLSTSTFHINAIQALGESPIDFFGYSKIKFQISDISALKSMHR